MSTSILRDSNESSKLNSPNKGITRTFLGVYESIEIIVTRLVRMIVNIFTFSISELAPVLAPLPPAFSIYLAMSQRLHMPFYVAIIAAGTIEVVGMYSAKISVRCYRWNSTKTKTEPAVPQGLSILMTSVFFVVVLLLALTVELAPSLTALTIPAFTLISVSTYVNLAISSNLEKLETDKANTLELRELKNGINAEIREAQKKFKNLAQNLADIDTQIDTRQKEFDTLIEEKQNELLVRDENIKSLAQKLTELDTQFDIRQQDFDTLQAQIEAKQNELNEYQKLVSNGHMIPVKMTNLETANKAKMTKIELRRKEVLSLLEQEMSQADIANELGVSVATVKRDIKVLNGSVK